MSQDVVERILDGAVDLHVHPYPSPFPRRMDAAEAAQRAAEAGMRAIVVKSHHHDTSTDVAALRGHGIASSGIDVFGGIALNTQVGGLNPHAVNLCLAMGGRVVWFPTIASPAHIEHHRAHPNLKFPQLAVDLIPEESSFHNWAIDVLVDWIRWVGPERSSLGSDLGQAGNPFPVDSFRKICTRLLEAGLNESEVRMLVADNPARLLGVDG